MLDPKEILTALADRFSITGKVQNVFGEPIEAHGKTIIPVARVQYGLGAGGGGENKSGADDAVGGSGGGGGVKVTPIGVLEITEAGARFVRFFDPQMATGLIAGGIMIGLLVPAEVRRQRSMTTRLINRLVSGQAFRVCGMTVSSPGDSGIFQPNPALRLPSSPRTANRGPRCVLGYPVAVPLCGTRCPAYRTYSHTTPEA
ncbi:MAG: spore germination protein GerW family protein [Candidatus Korobacteraceae bacterium]